MLRLDPINYPSTFYETDKNETFLIKQKFKEKKHMEDLQIAEQPAEITEVIEVMSDIIAQLFQYDPN